jgi:hypothetical protein
VRVVTRQAVAPAYRPLGLPIPDALRGLLSYAVTAALAAVLFGIQWIWYRAFSMYCVIAALASFAAVPWAVPETKAAWRKLRS